MWTLVGVPKKDAVAPPPWDSDVTDPKNYAPPSHVTLQICSSSDDMGLIIKICQKNMTLHLTFQGHWNQHGSSATYDFLLVIHSNHGPFPDHF